MTMLVSVCIPAYRQPSLLKRAVCSVLCQQHCEFEIVITDDSPDDEVFAALGELLFDSRLKYFKNVHRLGAIANWNESLRRASGEVIKILHHDDWLDSPTALAEFIEPIVSGKAAVTFSASRSMSLNGIEISIHRASPANLERLKYSVEPLVFSNILGAPSVIAFERSLMMEFDNRYTWLSDVDFYIRAITAARFKFEYIDKLLICATAESPLQLSRDCENNRVRTLLEYVRLYSDNLECIEHWRPVFQSFSSMLPQLTSYERLLVCVRSVSYGSKFVSLCLFCAAIIPRRIAALVRLN